MTKNLFILLVTIISYNRSYAQVPFDTAVDFTAKDYNSVLHRLYDYLNADKIVVIDFFTTSCGPCQTYASEINSAYVYFGCNQGNVIVLGINWGNDNAGVREFDSLWGATYPSISGLQGGGNRVVGIYEVMSYPTVIVIKPDRIISSKHIWPPTFDSLVDHVQTAGGLPAECTVGTISVKPLMLSAYSTGNGELVVKTNYQVNINSLIEIFSADGRLQYSTPVTEATTRVCHSFKNGIYLIRIRSSNGHSQSLKIIL